jgi:hypothetical protein
LDKANVGTRNKINGLQKSAQYPSECFDLK